jgi:biopolymer transport protein TolR
MGMTTGGSGDVNADINVTPMVDIMLVLLIIFMVVTPLLSAGVPVQIPKDVLGSDEDPDIIRETSVVLTVPNNTDFYVGKDQFSIENIGEKVKRLMENKTPDKRIVYIKSGVNVDYGTVVKVINEIRKQDIDKIGLVADKKKGGGAASQ